jgi:hypothetical protein
MRVSRHTARALAAQVTGERNGGELDELGKVEKALERVRETFRGLHPTVQQHVLQSAVCAAIDLLPRLSHLGGPGTNPLDLYRKAVKEDLLGPLQRDARISDDICNQVRAVYFQLPSNIQVRPPPSNAFSNQLISKSSYTACLPHPFRLGFCSQRSNTPMPRPTQRCLSKLRW